MVPVFRCGSRRYVLRPWHARAERGVPVTDPAVVRHVLRLLFRDPASARQLRRIADQAGGIGPRNDDQSIERLAAALARRHWILEEGPIESGHASGHRPQPRPPSAPPPPAPTPSPATSTTWFSVIVVDEDGAPVPGLTVTFDLGDRRETLTTGNAGDATWWDVATTASFARLRLGPVEDVRAALATRACTANGASVREGRRLVVGEDDLVVQLEAERALTVVLARPLVRVRLVGMHFDTNKSFLLPTALRGIRSLVEVYRNDPTGTLLILGHTDTTGAEAYNLDLSVERAEATRAFLQDDVAAWEAWYAAGKPAQKRWGAREDQAMIEALPCPPTVAGFQRWSNDARGTDLAVDGAAGPNTRRALIAAYMDLDGTTLPFGVSVEIHGCGEFFPDNDRGDDVEDADNRRVELYCFHHAVVPPVPGRTATRGEPEDPAWRRQVTRDVDVETAADELWVRLHDGDAAPMTDVPYRVLLGGRVRAEGTSADGWVVVFLPADVCPERVTVEWGAPDDDGVRPFHADLHVDCRSGGERAQAAARLHNLGYRTDGDERFEQAVRDFQRDYAIDETGLVAGAVPPRTRAALDAIFDGTCDATTPTKRPEPGPPEFPPGSPIPAS
jgi:outer membrane protein OmpA-like peptidoglycan-associated protein